MRSLILAFIGVLATSAAVSAQQHPAGDGQNSPGGAQPPQAQTADDLRQLLAGWEKSMHSLHTLSAQCMRTEKHKDFGAMEIYTGVAKLMRPRYALLEMERKDKPGLLAEKFICTGNFVYQFAPQQKELRVYELPPQKQGQAADDGFLAFLFGMKAADALQRFDLRLVKVDQWYVYVEIYPRTPADKIEFLKARLVLNRDSFLPRQLWFDSPQRVEITWDVLKIESNPKMDRKIFDPPQTPQGWKLVRVPRQPVEAPPRVYRPQNPK